MAVRSTSAILTLAVFFGALPSARSQTATSSPPTAAIPQAALGPTTSVLDPATQQKIHDLKVKVSHTNDPQRKKDLCQEIFELNTEDSFATQCLNDAETERKTEEAKEGAAKAEAAKKAKVERDKEEALASARNAFAGGSIALALSEISKARTLAPDDPEVKRLDGRIQQAATVQQRIRMIWGGGAIAAVVAVIGLIFVTRGKKEPYLEVVDGPSKGRRYKLEQEVVMIGAVGEYGGVKNDIVLSDPDRTISRFHCRIHRVGKKLYLVDKDSVNGTWVDRTRVRHETPVRLSNGSKISLAEVCQLQVKFERKKA